MADYDDSRYVIIERRSGTFAGFLWGAAVGAGLALLFAPRSGEQTRRELQDNARRLRDTAEGTVRRVQETVSDTLDDMRREVTERVDAAREAVEVGREAARETRADLEQRVRDSQAAARAGVDAARRHTPEKTEPGATGGDVDRGEDLEA